MKPNRPIVISVLFLLLNTIVVAQSLVEPTFKVRAVKDVLYGTAVRYDGGTDTLRMNIFVPTNDNATKRPLIVWIHGGGFFQGNRADFNTLAETWAKRGYTAVTISYRLGIHGSLLDPPFAYDEAEAIRACYRGIQDVRGGLRFLVKNAGAYGIDTSRCIIGGASAGSIIALHTAYFDTQDPIPAAAGKISDAARLSGTFPRPALGSPDGGLHTDVRTPSIKVVLNIFGALFDLKYLAGAPFIPLFSYHQIDDPVVPCAVNRAYHGLSIFSANYPYVSGTCAIEQELKKMGVADSDHGVIFYQGAAHEVHDPTGVDRAAAVFAAPRMTATTSVDDDETLPTFGLGWTLYGIDGRVVLHDADISQIGRLADGVYVACTSTQRRMLIVSAGRVAVGR
ncbi:MAG: alpha/beta hydrolase [Candidatus Kapaibacterium sp.]